MSFRVTVPGVGVSRKARRIASKREQAATSSVVGLPWGKWNGGISSRKVELLVMVAVGRREWGLLEAIRLVGDNGVVVGVVVAGLGAVVLDVADDMIPWLGGEVPSKGGPCISIAGTLATAVEVVVVVDVEWGLWRSSLDVV